MYLSKVQAKKMMSTCSPGPVYRPTAELGGQQVASNFETAPAVSFGIRPRPLSQDVVPGPGTYVAEGAVGAAPVNSRRHTSPNTRFGRSRRDGGGKIWLGEELMRTEVGKGTPGPEYSLADGVGRKELSSMRESAPSFSLGGRLRDPTGRSDTPGAGEYRSASALGQQLLSTKDSRPAARIGTSQRAEVDKMFISKGHDRTKCGLASPGPATALHVSAVGNQVQSGRGSSPAFGFGSSHRPAMSSSVTPGPGSYYA
mmetsp:Transcript_8182/g.24703  ORF Transcript_8182/g.24703 Transcript_8182/m.24703 type:complete len:256 (-) Transcript_8182:1105-1872(-)